MKTARVPSGLRISWIRRHLNSVNCDAFDDNNTPKFNALCVIADGRPELCDEISAASFAERAEIDLLSEYTAFASPPGVHLGGFSVGDAPTQPPVVPVPAAAEDSDDDGPTVPAPFNSCEWEGMGGLVPQFKVPNTVTFVDIVQAGRDPRALQFQNFNFGVDDTNSGILFDDSDTGSDSDVTVCQHESVLDEPVVPPPPQTFGGTLPIRFQRMALLRQPGNSFSNYREGNYR
ncbi:hypothetical protein CYMTET_16155 [Cymbomonas tetramitiformis]|uniref:Uncharacterized protein n=1 Tax=Cymbomonas tetramitiformis TaxID=36881 RepID=A0AAE0L8G4_9CHLO|nr:hypothetical protein CYMTET_16155 [Cymbomonas tetramitiformis]